MKRYLSILLLLGILSGLLYAVQDQEKVYLSLFDAHEYNLNMSMSTDANRLYANLQFKIDSARLPEAENYSFFISKRVLLERVKINGKSVPFFYTTGLDARHFAPPLENEMLLAPEAPVHCISIDKKYIKGESGEISVYLEFRSFLPEWTLDESGKEVLCWDTADFFYPRNVMHPATLNLEFSCISSFEMDAADSTTDTGSIRRIKRQILESPEAGNKIKIYKALN